LENGQEFFAKRKMKKVLEIAPYKYLPYYSGGQKSIALYLQYLGAETNLSVISVAGNDDSLQKSYRYLPLLKGPSSRYADFSLVSKIISLIRSENFDKVVWEHPYFAWLAWLVKKKTGVTTILHTHNIEYQRFRSTGKLWWPVLEKYEKWFLRFADRVFFKTIEDRDFAISRWKIEKEKCVIVPFGVEIKEYPSDKEQCRIKIHQHHKLDEKEKIFLFNGALNYKPNADAVNDIVNKINPLLLAKAAFPYKIIICGKGLPGEFNELKEYADRNIIYAGFVEDILTYFKGADLFLNPVQSGGGIKTKMVESIGFGTTVVATKTGAAGIDVNACGKKLVIVNDNDWDAFLQAINDNAGDHTITPHEYYNTYYWGNIAKNLATTVL